MAAAEGSDDVQLILPQGTDLTQLEAAACLIGSTSYPAGRLPSQLQVFCRLSVVSILPAEWEPVYHVKL